MSAEADRLEQVRALVDRAKRTTHGRLGLADDLAALLATPSDGERLRRITDLFSGGPDSPCRTTWRESQAILQGQEPHYEECVEVPLHDLRVALGEVADREPSA